MKLLRSREAPSPAIFDLGATPSRSAPPSASSRPSTNAWTPLEASISTPDPVEVPEPVIEPVVPAGEEPGMVVVGDAPLQPAEAVVESDEPLDGEPTTAEAAPAPAAKQTTPRRTPARTAPPAKKAAVKAPAKKAAAPRKAAPKKAAPKKVLAPWVNPDGLICPPTHPIKAKLSSQLFHLPGMFAYARTTPDRCYKSAEEALADGLRSAKR
jgi:hypothetical protein